MNPQNNAGLNLSNLEELHTAKVLTSCCNRVYSRLESGQPDTRNFAVQLNLLRPRKDTVLEPYPCNGAVNQPAAVYVTVVQLVS